MCEYGKEEEVEEEGKNEEEEEEEIAAVEKEDVDLDEGALSIRSVLTAPGAMIGPLSSPLSSPC